MRPALKRAVFLSVMALLVIGGLIYAFWPRPVPVDLAAVDRGDIQVTVDGEGRTNVREVYTVSPQIAGRITRIKLQPGDVVEAGKTLITSLEETEPAFLDARTRARLHARVEAAEAAYDLARAELEREQAELEFQRSELSRAERLYERGAVTERTLEEARVLTRVREAQVGQARAAMRMRLAEVNTARAELIEPGEYNYYSPAAFCCIPVRAPVSGVVLRVLEEDETVVSPGTPLIEIGDPDDLEIVVDLPSEQAVRVEPGSLAIIENWGGQGVLHGTVRRIEPYGFTKVTALGIEEQRVNVVIDFVRPDQDYADQNHAAKNYGGTDRARLGHGYRVLARIVTVDRKDAVRVPVGALFRIGREWSVFVREDGRAVLRSVEIGANDGRHAEVLDGLEETDPVILYPSDRVADGARIVER